MLTVYSPLSLRVRFLSSRDPVKMKSSILSLYSGAIFIILVTVIILLTPNFQDTDSNGFSIGVSVVVNVTISPTAAFRGPSDNTPAPLVKPGGDSYRCEWEDAHDMLKSQRAWIINVIIPYCCYIIRFVYFLVFQLTVYSDYFLT